MPPQTSPHWLRCCPRSPKYRRPHLERDIWVFPSKSHHDYPFDLDWEIIGKKDPHLDVMGDQIIALPQALAHCLDNKARFTSNQARMNSFQFSVDTAKRCNLGSEILEFRSIGTWKFLRRPYCFECCHVHVVIPIDFVYSFQSIRSALPFQAAFPAIWAILQWCSLLFWWPLQRESQGFWWSITILDCSWFGGSCQYLTHWEEINFGLFTVRYYEG